MLDIIQMFILFIVTINIIGVAIGISKWAAARNAETVYGKVVNIRPMYRSAEYTVEINDQGRKYRHTFTARTWFSGYSMNTRLAFYKIQTPDGFKIRAKNGYYMWTWVLIIVPWISLIGVMLES